MVYNKSCPGSRTIREPRPEEINCPGCGIAVEIWTDELKATCPGCGDKVYRAQQASCIDWCPHARDCVGPEVYERLRPGLEEELTGTDSPLAIVEREHERALEMLGLLRGAGICLKMGTNKGEAPIRERGLEHLAKVLGFFEKDLGLHFRREEEVLFPSLEKHLGVEKSPTRRLLQEHREVWEYYERLRDKLGELQGNESGPSAARATEVQDISHRIEQFLKEHIRKENESLFPLTRGLLSGQELERVPEKLRAVK